MLLRRLTALAYTPGAGRDLRIDFLRGFAVFAMVVDHLAGPSLLYLLTGGNRFFTSAAEGFVFISGLMVGLAYRRIAERDGLAVALRRLLERAWVLYVLAVGLTLAILPISETLNLPWAQGIDRTDPVALVWSIVTLHQTYYLVDVPLLYALLLGVAPAAFLLLHERRTWIVLLTSWLLWAGYQVYPDRTELPWSISGNYLFFFAAWQVLFFTGMVIGYHRQRISRAVPDQARVWLLLVSGLGFAALVLLHANTDRVLMAIQALRPNGMLGGYSLSTDLLDLLFAKASVAPGRIVASATVFTFLYLLTTALWQPLRRGLGWLLLPLGQQALWAYAAHVVVAVVIGLASSTAGVRLQERPGWSLLIQVASVGLLWLAIRRRVLVPDAQTRRLWMASVVPLALMAVVMSRLDPQPQLPGLAVVDPAVVAADSGVRVARAFGTPVPRAVERARRFGTPVPKTAQPQSAPAAQSRAAPLATALPLPAPPLENEPRLRTFDPNAIGMPRASLYVGETVGTFRELWFYSSALDREMPYFVYLPPRYGTASRRYPVLYMLHGGSQDRDEWPAYGLVNAVDRLIAEKEIRPMIVVMPQGDYGFWVNHVDDGPKWGDYVSQDLVRHVDATFRTLPDAQNRAIGGLSMGGYGALQLAFNNPDVFGTVGGHSPALYPDDGSLPILGTGEAFAARDPVRLAESANGLDRLSILLDIGEEDPFAARTVELHEALDRRGVEHRWLLQRGGHEGEYWERNLLQYLRFYDEALNWGSGS